MLCSSYAKFWSCCSNAKLKSSLTLVSVFPSLYYQVQCSSLSRPKRPEEILEVFVVAIVVSGYFISMIVVQCGHFSKFVKVYLSNPFTLQLSLLDVIKLAQFLCTLLAGRVCQSGPAKAQCSAVGSCWKQNSEQDVVWLAEISGRFLKGWLHPNNLAQSLEMLQTHQHFVVSSGPSPVVAACLLVLRSS